MKKKLFVFDIDGTLLTSDNKLLDSTIVALDYLRRKHKIILATGRSRFLIQPLLDQLHVQDYIVCNGSAAFIKNKQVYKRTLDKEKLWDLIEHLGQQGIDLALTGLDDFCRISSYQVDRMEAAMHSIGALIPKYAPNFYRDNDIYQGLAFYDNLIDATFETEFLDFRFVRWHDSFVDIIPKQGSKATTMLEVAKMMGISVKDIIAFGDENNDIEMLKVAGVGIAMGNANAKVKTIADYVTSSNNDDGIVHALEKLKFL